MQHLMHHVTISLQQSKITLQNNFINNTSITQPTLSFYLWLKMYNLQLSRKLLWLEPYCSTPEVQQTSSKAGSGINILYLLTGPIGPTGYHYQIHKTVYGLPAAEYTHTHTHTHTSDAMHFRLSTDWYWWRRHSFPSPQWKKYQGQFAWKCLPKPAFR